MARMVNRYRCPVCNRICESRLEAERCRNAHPIQKEFWAFSNCGAGYRIDEHVAPESYGSKEWALKKAEESDNRR